MTPRDCTCGHVDDEHSGYVGACLVEDCPCIMFESAEED